MDATYYGVLTEMAEVHSYMGMGYFIEQIWKSVGIAFKIGLFLNPEEGQGTLCYSKNQELHFISCTSVWQTLSFWEGAGVSLKSRVCAAQTKRAGNDENDT